jgi:hypothetical protein
MSYIGSTPTTQSFIAGTDSFNGTGSATNFTLSRFVNSVNDVQVVVNNVVQYPPNYSVSGTTLTISPAPSAGTNNVYVRYLSTTLQSIAPSQGIGIQFGIGSAALPSISFIGDANTGIYSPAADTIAFAEGGVEAVRFDSSGNVGIGTSSPVSRLNVSIPDGGGVTISNTNDSHTGNLNFGDTSSNASGRISYDHFSNALRFDTSGTERARIDTSGNLLVGTTSNIGSGYKVSIQPAASGGGGVAFRNVGPDGVPHVFFNSSNGVVGSIQTTNTATSFVTSSDYRLKEDVQPMVGALARVFALKPVTYKWKLDGSGSEGFIAHELQAVVPDCVTGEKDAVDADGNPVYQGIDTSFLVATIVAAIQEQQAMIDTMKQEIAELKAKVGE